MRGSADYLTAASKKEDQGQEKGQDTGDLPQGVEGQDQDQNPGPSTQVQGKRVQGRIQCHNIEGRGRKKECQGQMTQSQRQHQGQGHQGTVQGHQSKDQNKDQSPLI